MISDGQTKQPVDEFDRLAALARRMLKSSIAMVTLIEADRQFFIGASGLPAEIDSCRETPLSYSICEIIADCSKPLIINDAAKDDRVANNLAVIELGVAAYLGYPLVSQDGTVYGAFCVIDKSPREWTATDLELVREFTAIAARQLDLESIRNRQQSSLDVVIHDLKSPLSGVQMIASILSDQLDGIPKNLHPLIESLTESVDKAMNLVISLGHRDRVSSESGCNDPQQVVGEAIDSIIPRAKEKSIEVETHAGAEEIQLTVASWVVEQVVHNLLENAVKFTPANGKVEIRSYRRVNTWVLEIADDGPGFSEDDRKRLYRRYAQLSARPTAGEPSSGLGLSIVKRLVEQEGGTIELTSTPGQGAVFVVSFPLGKVDDPTP